MSLAVQINKTNGIPLYIQLEEQIRLLMHQGHLQAGDLMPTVRQLAVELEVNSNTVSRVYRDLQSEGLLTLKRGVGTFVAEGGTVRPMSGRDVGALEKKVDALIALSRRMKVTSIELFQLIETRWKENT
ncbi:MAG: GntR family transcriptional regulator [Pirellulaceae bacterium]|jgi:GntR family transcriptional regulator|nr:GntR family transcriptional regulator [Pirellulaceae bacterium]MDP7017533.1 GntR family transcriptional regulator [Pirellulaceae bacterium]